MSLNWMINSLTNYRETGTWENLRVSSFVEIFKLVGTSLNDIFDADSIISKVRELKGQSTEYCNIKVSSKTPPDVLKVFLIIC